MSEASSGRDSSTDQSRAAGRGDSPSKSDQPDPADDSSTHSSPYDNDPAAGTDKAPARVYAETPGTTSQSTVQPAIGSAEGALSEVPELRPHAPPESSSDKRIWGKYEVVAVAAGVMVAILVALGSMAVAVWSELNPDPLPATTPQLPTIDDTQGQPIGDITDRCSNSTRVGWGPDRPMVGAQTVLPWAGFNSERNNPNIGGDERNFVGSRDVDSNGLWGNDVRVEHGKRYSIRVYVRNSAADMPDNVATDTRVRYALPDCKGTQLGVNAYIRSPDAFPIEVWDGVNFHADIPFRLRYVANTAVLESNGFPGPPPGKSINGTDFLSRPGQLIGFDNLDGQVRGGYYYAMYLTIQVEADME